MSLQSFELLNGIEMTAMSVMGKMPAAGPKSLGSTSATVNRNHHAMLLPMCAQSLHGYLQWSALAPICRLNQNATRLPALQQVLLRLHLYLSHHVLSTSNPVQKEAWQSHNGLTKTKKNLLSTLVSKTYFEKAALWTASQKKLASISPNLFCGAPIRST